MKHYTNNFRGLTTIVVEIEDQDNIDLIIPVVKQHLDSLGAFCRCLTTWHNSYEDLPNGDVVKFWQFFVLTNRNDNMIQDSINNISNAILQINNK